MKGAIFDVDGTLLDSMGVWYKISDRFFQENGLVLTPNLATKFQEMTLEESLPFIVERFSLPTPVEAVFDRFQELMREEYLSFIPLKPYAKEYVQKLHGQGIKIALATSGYRDLCQGAFERLGLWHCFDAVALSSEVGVNKGNPDVYLLAAQRLGLAPEDCMVYEDIPLGITGAKKAKMKTTAIYDITNEPMTNALKQLSDHYITGWHELL